jgi:type I restriction enzyme R subunit
LAQLEATGGSENRVKTIVRDPVAHFEERLAAMDGKAMIVCMSRRICVDVYRELIALRPEWHHADDDTGALKVVMTGSVADPADWQPHIRNKSRREALANWFRDPRDPSASSSCATCGIPASTRPACIRCMLISQCESTG